MILMLFLRLNEVGIDFRTEGRTERYDEGDEALYGLVVHEEIDHPEHRAGEGDVRQDGAHH